MISSSLLLVISSCSSNLFLFSLALTLCFALTLTNSCDLSSHSHTVSPSLALILVLCSCIFDIQVNKFIISTYIDLDHCCILSSLWYYHWAESKPCLSCRPPSASTQPRVTHQLASWPPFHTYPATLLPSPLLHPLFLLSKSNTINQNSALATAIRRDVVLEFNQNSAFAAATRCDVVVDQIRGQRVWTPINL